MNFIRTRFVFLGLLGLPVWAQEKGEVVSFEAESFIEQSVSDVRAWHIVKKDAVPDLKPDADPPHLEGASGAAYIEALPDTRRTHDDKLIHGENFAPEPGKMAILKYRVNFPKAGKYYVWARAFSTGTEDNGFHIGLNGEWPESGRRWQTVIKKRWHWECKQRTAKVHTGVPMQLFLEIPKAGEHEILVSMREDGCELDKFVLATDRDFRPAGFTREAEKSKKVAVKIERQPDGDGSVEISGELKTWHKVTLTVDGPWAHELDVINVFTDYSLTAKFVHQESGEEFEVPGFFAADGNASETSAISGKKWRVNFVPNQTGKWNYSLNLTIFPDAAIGGEAHTIGTTISFPIANSGDGSFEIAPTEKQLPDLRARGRLQYIGERYLKFAGDGTYFLKAGPDAPETFLAYEDFDGTRANSPGKGPLKSWKPHVEDWREGDPTWKNGKGKGMIGAVNYLAEKGVNSFSFLPYNAGGDGDNIWPFVDRDTKFHYDVSKLDQWGIVFDHATSRGMHLHFKLQETEIDDNRRGHKKSEPGVVPTSLDGGKLGRERKLYLREIVARFGHNLALNWNLGEENTQSPEEIRAMAEYLRQIDPYDHPIVIHTYPDQQDKVYTPLLGDKSLLTGTSLQNSWDAVHRRTLHWISQSEKAGKKWVVANDEQNPADMGVPPDPGYAGHGGFAEKKNGQKYDLHDIRRDTLWGNLMAGGAGVEYYFGYKLPENDLKMEDFRSRDKSWDYCRIALEFFQKNEVPFWEMKNANALVGNEENENGKPWCLAKAGEVYVVFVPRGGEAELKLEGGGKFSQTWHAIEESGAAVGQSEVGSGNVKIICGEGIPEGADYVVLIRKN